jgi:GTP1/Obg family GTP-binding protein
VLWANTPFSHAGGRIAVLQQLKYELRKLSGLESDFNATSIVTVGDQSHGKSSVIEALSGVDLPGIKTRVPLVMMLRQVS